MTQDFDEKTVHWKLKCAEVQGWLGWSLDNKCELSLADTKKGDGLTVQFLDNTSIVSICTGLENGYEVLTYQSEWDSDGICNLQTSHYISGAFITNHFDMDVMLGAKNGFKALNATFPFSIKTIPRYHYKLENDISVSSCADLDENLDWHEQNCMSVFMTNNILKRSRQIVKKNAFADVYSVLPDNPKVKALCSMGRALLEHDYNMNTVQKVYKSLIPG